MLDLISSHFLRAKSPGGLAVRNMQPTTEQDESKPLTQMVRALFQSESLL